MLICLFLIPDQTYKTMKSKYLACKAGLGRSLVAMAGVVAISATLFSFTYRSASEAVFQRLGMSQTDANQNISKSVLQGYLTYYGAKNIKSIATGDRAAIVKDLMLYSMQYTNSEAFINEYQAMREQRKPEAPAEAESEEDIRNKMVADLKKSIASTEESMAKMNDDMKKMMAESLTMLKEQLKEYENPNSELVKMMAQGAAQGSEFDKKAYEENLAKWQQEYPEDHRKFVKMRLQQFLDQTKDIDFDAALKDNGYGKKKFVNSAYEAKSADWKKAFRAGREATTTARQLAQEWVQEL